MKSRRVLLLVFILMVGTMGLSQTSSDLATNLIAEIVGIHLPTLLLGDVPTLLQILECSDDDGRMFRRSHQLMTRTVVFGEAGILPVRHFGAFA